MTKSMCREGIPLIRLQSQLKRKLSLRLQGLLGQVLDGYPSLSEGWGYLKRRYHHDH